MTKNRTDIQSNGNINAQPRLHQRAREIQAYGTVSHMLPLELEEPVRLEIALAGSRPNFLSTSLALRQASR